MKRQLLAIVGFIFLCVSSYATTFMKVETTDGNIDRYDVENVIEVDFETEMTHEYVDLGLPSGTLWATCNIGATQPEEYGDYFAWGETEPKNVYDMSTYKWQRNNIFTKYNPDIDSYTTLLPEDDAATANWGDEWRMPTSEEQIELFKECTYSWEEVDGVYGAKFTGPNGNSVFFPAVGCRYLSYLDYVGEYGYYWSSSLYDTDYAYYMDFNEKSSYEGRDFVRYGGCSVRAVRAQKQQRYVDLGLPSGTLWATCNIGASQPEEYGDYFAWGETKPKEVYNLGTYKWINDNVFTKYNQDIDSYSTLLPEDDAATANWGDEWRMPTSDEQRELVEKCTYSWEEVEQNSQDLTVILSFSLLLASVPVRMPIMWATTATTGRLRSTRRTRTALAACSLTRKEHSGILSTTVVAASQFVRYVLRNNNSMLILVFLPVLYGRLATSEPLNQRNTATILHGARQSQSRYSMERTINGEILIILQNITRI
ncbi:MAG: hypothetical protein MJZ34_02040 [Paludibacteraceae bacterium]|nr:hypothetical protein [Paludibacteraceae bacterium]